MEPIGTNPWLLAHWDAQMARAAYTLRVTRDPILALRALAEGVEGIQRLMYRCVADCRALGHSWTEIGEALGVTKQAAQKHYGDHNNEKAP